MCKGEDCPFKNMCYRYTALPDEFSQSYFKEPPFKIEKGKPSCEMYWGDAAQSLFVMLKEITNGKHNNQTSSKKNNKVSKATPEKRKRNSKRN